MALDCSCKSDTVMIILLLVIYVPIIVYVLYKLFGEKFDAFSAKLHRNKQLRLQSKNEELRNRKNEDVFDVDTDDAEDDLVGDINPLGAVPIENINEDSDGMFSADEEEKDDDDDDNDDNEYEDIILDESRVNIHDDVLDFDQKMPEQENL